MRNILLIFGILFLTTITVNGQDTFRKMSIKKDLGSTTEITNENTSTDLYDAIYKDFENYFRKLTSLEKDEDEENTSIYDELFRNFSFIYQVDNEKKEDQENENIYLQLLIDMVKRL